MANESDGLITLVPTVDEWFAAGVEDLIALAVPPHYAAQHEILDRARKQAEIRGDHKRARVLALAADVMSMMLKTEDGETVLHPVLVTPTWTSARVDSFSEDQATLLQEIVSDLTDPEFQARVADLLWSRQPRERWARIAVLAYLRSLYRLQEDLPHDLRDHLSRAFQIARSLKRSPEVFNAVDEYARMLILKASDDKFGQITADIAEVMLRHKSGDDVEVYETLMQSGNLLRHRKEYSFAQRCFNVAYRWASRRMHDEFREGAAIGAEAECVLADAERFSEGDPQTALILASRLEDAIQIYRRSAVQYEDRIASLKAQLPRLQAVGEQGLASVSVEAAVPPEIVDLINEMRSLPIEQVLHTLALHIAPPPLDFLRERAVERLRDHPLLAIFGSVLMREGGRTDAHMTNVPIGSNSAEAREAWNSRIREEMLRERMMARELTATVFIEPVRDIVAENNPVASMDFSSLMRNNSFVPKDRTEVYLKGFIYGLLGDYMLSTSLLVPQVENSLRHLLSAEGIPTSKYNREGIQDELSLAELLSKEEYRAQVDLLLGESLAFELEGLLISRFGSNLRNRLSHGLLSDDALKGPQSCFFWGFTVLLLLRFYQPPDIPSN